MGVRVKADNHKAGRWWVRINHQGHRKSLAFNSRKAAEIAVRLQQRAYGGVRVDDLSGHVVLDEEPDPHDHSDQKQDAAGDVPARR